MTEQQLAAMKLALEYLRDNQHYIADNERHAYVMEYNAFVERLEALADHIPDATKMVEPAQQQEPVTVLPDTSAFAVMSYPLPKDHWLYADRQYNDGAYEPAELGKPVLTYELRVSVVSAVRYAIRGATNCGKDMGFDPDALVQNAVYALCGTYTSPQPAQPQEPVAWCPDVCPITGLPFFMWIEHHETGQKVPTYGGPYDSYTIPVRDKDGSYCRERYDHDLGGWLIDEVEDVGVQIVSDQAYVSDEPPASKPWVGLTDEERIELMERTHPKNRWPLLSLCEDKLREKNAQPSKPLTDEQITAGAKALCKQMAEACGINARDQWQFYADTFKEDAKAVLEAAHNIKENT